MANPSNLLSHIQEIVVRASSELARAIRADVAGGIRRAVGVAPPAATPKRRGRPPRAARTATAPAAKPGRARLVRRTSAQVAKDDAKIFAFVKAHANVRSVDIQKDVRLPKQNIASGLERLRSSGKVKAKGKRSATRYSAA
jgi:hypothetical protein